MGEFRAAYVPIGVGTFHMESAEDLFCRSVKMVRECCPGAIVPEKKEDTLSTDLLGKYLDQMDPDLIILQNLTFANAAYSYEVLRRFPETPILLWTLREPAIDGGRLRLNSLTGAFSAANAYRAFRDTDLLYVFGNPEEENVIEALRNAYAAAKLKKELKSLRIAAIGHTPQGFGFGRALDQEMMKTFGCELLSIESRELISRAKTCPEEEADEWLKKTKKSINGLEGLPEKNVRDFARLYKAYSEYVTENRIGALASRCWPDFFVDFGTPNCAVLSLLNDENTVASCESDTYGALSMYMAKALTGSSVFFGDPVSLDEKEGTITFWHCGMAAPSLACSQTGACAGVHPNRKIGPTMEFGCKEGEEATIFRAGRTKDGKFRFFITEGKILDKPRQFLGTSLVVQTDHPSREIVESAVRDAWEPHFVVAYGRVGEKLAMLGSMLGIEVCRY